MADFLTPEELKKRGEVQTTAVQQPYSIPTIGSTSSTLTGSSFTSIPNLEYKNPNPVPYTPSSAVDTTVQPIAAQPSKPEQDISSLIKSITEAQTADTGKTAFTQQQEQDQGLLAAQNVQTSLSKQILALQAEAKNIPDIMQQQATGRGITAEGLHPLTIAALRENSIKANILGAQLDAAKLDVASARQRIDFAVTAKFGPLEEDIAAKKANLNLLLQDPNIGIAEKNRAAAQQLILKQQEATVALQKQTQTDIWNVSVTAAQNSNNFKPTQQYGTAAEALRAIQNSPSKEIALQIAADTGLTKPSTALSDFEQAFFRTYGRLPTVDELTDYNQKKFTTETERMNILKTAAFSKARPELEKSIGKDGFVNPRIYIKLRNDYAQAIGNIKDFDDTFSVLLNPQDRINLGIQSASSLISGEAPTPPFQPTSQPQPTKRWWEFWK